jgi:hypothetical protein
MLLAGSAWVIIVFNAGGVTAAVLAEERAEFGKYPASQT